MKNEKFRYHFSFTNPKLYNIKIYPDNFFVCSLSFKYIQKNNESWYFICRPTQNGTVQVRLNVVRSLFRFEIKKKKKKQKINHEKLRVERTDINLKRETTSLSNLKNEQTIVFLCSCFLRLKTAAVSRKKREGKKTKERKKDRTKGKEKGKGEKKYNYFRFNDSFSSSDNVNDNHKNVMGTPIHFRV